MAGVEHGQLGGARRAFRREKRCRNCGEGAHPLFLGQRGIAPRRFGGHSGAEIGGQQRLPSDQRGGDLAADVGVTHLLFGEQLAVEFVRKMPVRPLQRGHLAQFAVNQPLAGNDAVALAKRDDGGAIDDLRHRLFEPALRDKAAHRQLLVLPARVVEHAVDAAPQLVGGDRVMADAGGGVGAGQSAQAAARSDAAERETERDDAKQTQRDFHAEPRLQKIPDKTKHGSEYLRAGARLGSGH